VSSRRFSFDGRERDRRVPDVLEGRGGGERREISAVLRGPLSAAGGKGHAQGEKNGGRKKKRKKKNRRQPSIFFLLRGDTYWRGEGKKKKEALLQKKIYVPLVSQ